MSLKKARANITSMTTAQRGLLLYHLVKDDDLEMVDLTMECGVNQDDIAKAAKVAADFHPGALATILIHFPGTVSWRDSLLETAVDAGDTLSTFVLNRPNGRLMTSLQARENSVKDYLAGKTMTAEMAAVLSDSEISHRLQEKILQKLEIESGDSKTYGKLRQAIINRKPDGFNLRDRVIAENPSILAWKTAKHCHSVSRWIPERILTINSAFFQNMLSTVTLNQAFNKALLPLESLQSILDREDAPAIAARCGNGIRRTL